MRILSLLKLNSLLILGIFLIGACSEDVEPTPPIAEPPIAEPPIDQPVNNANWEKLTVFSEDMYNGITSGSKFIALGRNNLYYDASMDAENEAQFLGNYLTRLGRYKLPLSESIFVSRTELDVFVFPMGILDPANAITLTMSVIDPEFKSFEDIQFWQGDVLGVNRAGTAALIPYRTIVNGLSVNNPSFLLLKTEVVNGVVSVKETILVKENLRGFYVETNSVKSYDNFFIVQIEGRSYKIDHEGAVEELGIWPTSAVVLDNEVVYLEENRDQSNLVVYSADLEGKNKSLVGQMELTQDIERAGYVAIDNQIIGYNGTKLFNVNISGPSVKLELLANGNLQGSVSSLNKIGDDELVVTIIRLGVGGVYKISTAKFFGIQ